MSTPMNVSIKESDIIKNATEFMVGVNYSVVTQTKMQSQSEQLFRNFVKYIKKSIERRSVLEEDIWPSPWYDHNERPVYHTNAYSSKSVHHMAKRMEKMTNITEQVGSDLIDCQIFTESFQKKESYTNPIYELSISSLNTHLILFEFEHVKYIENEHDYVKLKRISLSKQCNANFRAQYIALKILNSLSQKIKSNLDKFEQNQFDTFSDNLEKRLDYIFQTEMFYEKKPDIKNEFKDNIKVCNEDNPYNYKVYLKHGTNLEKALIDYTIPNKCVINQCFSQITKHSFKDLVEHFPNVAQHFYEKTDEIKFLPEEVIDAFVF